MEAFSTHMEYRMMGTTFNILIFSECIIWIVTFLGSRGQEKKKSDKGTLWLVICGWVACLMAVQFWGSKNAPDILRWQLPHFVFDVGIALVGVGIVIRYIAVFTLKRAFTLSVQTTEKQHLIQKGLYRIVRNPAYTGSIVSLLGTALAFREITGVISVLILCAICYGIRINVEEKALADQFQQEFQDYCKRTKYRLFPGIY